MQNNPLSHVMNTNTHTLTKVSLAAVALIGLCFIGLTNKHADYLPMLGIGVSYLAALAILGFAALDGSRARRLS